MLLFVMLFLLFLGTCYSNSRIDYGNRKILIEIDRNIAIRDYGIPEAISENIWYYGGSDPFFVCFSDDITLSLFPRECSVILNSPLEFKAYANISGIKFENVTNKAHFLINEPQSISITKGNIIIAKQEGSFVIMSQYSDKFSNPCFLEIKKENLKEKKPDSISVIEVLPHKPKVPLNSTLNFIALGVLSGREPGSFLVKDISNEVKWLRTENGITTQEKNNEITFRNPGVSLVKCAYKGIESYEQQIKVLDTLYKTEPHLNYITILPEFCAGRVGNLINLKAFGTYSDNRVAEITDSVDWEIENAGSLKQTESGAFLLQDTGIIDVWCKLQGVESVKVKVTSLDTAKTPVLNQNTGFFVKQKIEAVNKAIPEKTELTASFIGREVVSLRIVPEKIEFNSGETRSIAALATYSDGKEEDVTLLGDWVSSNESVLTVSFGEIKTVSAGISTISFKFHDKFSAQAIAVVKSSVLRSISVLPASIEMPFASRVKLEATGYYSDNSCSEITSLVNWKIDHPVCIKIIEAIVSPTSINKTKLYAEYSGVKSLPVKIRVFADARFIIGIFFKSIVTVIGVLLMVLFCLFAITKYKTAKLRKTLNNNPGGFILALNNNLIKILRIYGINNDQQIPPVEFATLVESKLRISNGIFVKLTKIVLEVKFSKHAFTYKNALDFTTIYDEFIRILCAKTGKLTFLRNYCRALLLGIQISRFM